AYGDESRQQWDLPTDQPGRIARAVDALVVVEDHLSHRSVTVESADHGSTILTVALDERPVIFGQLGGAQNSVRERELADVVEQTGRERQVLLALRERLLLRERASEAGDRCSMAGGGGIAKRKRLEQSRQHSNLQLSKLV